jgi:hypothetical protein
MTQFVDFYKDKDKALLAEIRQEKAELPPFIVNHRAMSDEELGKLSRGSFADQASRTFPICSKAETWHSIAYFNKQLSKQAKLSPMSAQAREEIRETLAKAASLWGLDDEEVEKLREQVNLKVTKTAEAENCIEFAGTAVPVRTAAEGKDAVYQFLDVAYGMPEQTRRHTALGVMKAASSVGAKIEEEDVRTLLQHAGAATCTVGDAVTVLDSIIPFIPHYAEACAPACGVRDELLKRKSGDLLDPKEVNDLVASLEGVAHKFNIKQASISDSLRRITPADIEAEHAAIADVVKLPGGIMARKSAISENAMNLSDMLHNMYSVEAHRPEEIISALSKMTPREILPLRAHIGA